MTPLIIQALSMQRYDEPDIDEAILKRRMYPSFYETTQTMDLPRKLEYTKNLKLEKEKGQSLPQPNFSFTKQKVMSGS